MTAFRGTPVSEGEAAGELYLPDTPPAAGPPAVGPPAAGPAAPGAAGQGAALTAEDVRAAFGAVAAERGELAAALRAAGRDHKAGIVQVGALIAADPRWPGRRRTRSPRGPPLPRRSAAPPKLRPPFSRRCPTPTWRSVRATCGRSPRR